ncbi:alpha/beta hydrolase [soil metagenome]
MTVTDTRRLVDPALLDVLDMMPTVALSNENLAEIRAASRIPIPAAGPEGEAIEMTRRTVPGSEGAPDVGVIVYRPMAATSALPCILHIHGGGYVLGSAEAQEGPHRMLAVALDCVIVTVDYRLAPETVAPGAVEDCYAALAWTFDNADDLGVDPARIGVSGESAGGGLAASLALMTRDRGRYALAFQHLVYPMLDDRTCVHADPHPHAGEYIWTPHNNHFGWAALLGVAPGAEGVSPYAAAARAEDLSGLPKTFIQTGALDLFGEEDLEYARRLIRAGVATELHIYPGGFHGFDFHPTAPVSVQARRDSFDFLKRAVG